MLKIAMLTMVSIVPEPTDVEQKQEIQKNIKTGTVILQQLLADIE
jgi:hypothetical protein